MFPCALSFSLVRPIRASAASSNTINFQARLETSAGVIVPDGTYNVEFKLYSVATLGSAEWTEDYTYNSGPGATDARIRVVNGYLTANLGSITAFPGTINWNQQQWLTMNIGGTVGSGTITWDGEMSPRLQLTAVPYAFQAGVLSSTSGSNVGTLSFGTISNPTDAITLPDASGTVCLQSSSACGFATGSGTAFLQGGNSFGAQGVLGTNDSNGLTIRTNNANRLVIDTSGNLQLQQASTFNIASAAGGSQLTIQAGANSTAAGTGGTLLLQGGAPGTTGASGSVVVKANTNDSTTAFQVQNAAGTSTVLNVDTLDHFVGVGTSAPVSTLNVVDTLFSDNFNRANSSSLGSNWTKVVDAGSDFQIVSNQLAMTSSDNSNNALGVYTTQGISGADYSVQSDISVSAGTNWVDVFGRGSLYGANDTQGYYLFAAYVGGANRLYLYKRVTGTWTQLASANETFATGTTYTLRLVIRGSNLYGYLNGVLAVSATDSTFASAGFAGVGVGNPNTTNITWDNFAITSLTPSFNLNGVTVMNSNGWLGIDNTNPQYGLDVNGGGNFATSVLAPVLDTASGMNLTIGGTNAWNINLGNSSTNFLTTVHGTALVKPTPTHDSTTAFQVQNAGGISLLTVDTSNGRLIVGSGSTGDTTGYLLVLDSKTTANDPTGVAGAMYYNAADAAFRCDNSVDGWRNCNGVPRPNSRRWTYITYPGSGTSFDTEGDTATTIGNAPTSNPATTTEAPRLSFVTSATIGNADGISGNPNYATSTNPDFQTHTSGTVSGVRLWMVLTDQSAATMDGASAPTGNYAGFRLDTGAGDSAYQCVTSNGSSQTITSSGVTATSSGGKFEVLINTTAGNVVFEINDQVVCTISTTLPSSSALLNYQVSTTALGAVAKTLNIPYVYIDNYYSG